MAPQSSAPAIQHAQNPLTHRRKRALHARKSAASSGSSRRNQRHIAGVWTHRPKRMPSHECNACHFAGSVAFISCNRLASGLVATSIPIQQTMPPAQHAQNPAMPASTAIVASFSVMPPLSVPAFPVSIRHACDAKKRFCQCLAKMARFCQTLAKCPRTRLAAVGGRPLAGRFRRASERRAAAGFRPGVIFGCNSAAGRRTSESVPKRGLALHSGRRQSPKKQAPWGPQVLPRFPFFGG